MAITITGRGQQKTPLSIQQDKQPIYRKTIRQTIPGGGITYTEQAPEETPGEKINYQVQATMADIAAKKKRESTENYTLAMGKLFQSYALFTKMNEYNKKILNVDVPSDYGGRGALNWMQKYTKTNPWVESFIGDQNTTAMFATRAIMPTRAVRMVEMYKESLPDIWSSDDIGLVQAVQSMADTHLSWAGKNLDKFPELSPTTDPAENVEKQKIFRAKNISKIAKMLVQVREEIRNAPPEALRPDGMVMMSPDGSAELVSWPKKGEKMGEVADKYSKGYRIPNAEDIQEMKIKGIIQ